MKIKGFIEGLFEEGRLWVIVGLLSICIACAWYIHEHEPTHPVHHVSDFLTK